MTVGEMIEQLQQIDPDLPVNLVFRGSGWPMSTEVGHVEQADGHAYVVEHPQCEDFYLSERVEDQLGLRAVVD